MAKENGDELIPPRPVKICDNQSKFTAIFAPFGCGEVTGVFGWQKLPPEYYTT